MRLWAAPAACLAFIGAAWAQKKPNLLFIVTDQQRFDAMGLMQERMGVAQKHRISTPNLDRLAREGAMFTNAYSVRRGREGNGRRR